MPREFHEIRRCRGNYDELVSEEKDKLKTILLREQNNRCAYCTRRIDLNSSTIEHYIPRNGPHGDITQSLDYNNLFAVCNATRKLQLKHKTCDDKKGDELLRIDPRIQTHINTIKYDKKGIISSDNTDFDDDLNITLNLNTQALINSRYAAFDSLLKRMSKKKSGKWSRDFIQRILDKYKSKDDDTPYAGFIIYQLEKRLQKL